MGHECIVGITLDIKMHTCSCSILNGVHETKSKIGRKQLNVRKYPCY